MLCKDIKKTARTVSGPENTNAHKRYREFHARKSWLLYFTAGSQSVCMTLPLGQTVSNGVQRTLSTTGLVIFVLTAASQLLLVGATNTIVASIITDLPPEATSTEIGITVPVSVPVAAAIAVSVTLFGTVVFLVSTRLLTREQHELSTLPRSLCTRRIGRATLSGVGMSLILTPLILLGMPLIIPGLFFAVSFQFGVFLIGVEDARAIGALRQSWRLASGNRWRLVAILVAFTIVAMALGMGTALVSGISPAAGQVVSVTAMAAIIVMLYGVLAEAYLSLRDESTNRGGSTSSSSTAVDPL
jgi:hypothetical protein